MSDQHPRVPLSLDERLRQIDDMLAKLAADIAAMPQDVCLRIEYLSLVKHRRQVAGQLDDDLPTLDDVRALGPWDTGGLDSVAFVRAIRDAPGGSQ